jgi:hypothetical protein
MYKEGNFIPLMSESSGDDEGLDNRAHGQELGHFNRSLRAQARVGEAQGICGSMSDPKLPNFGVSVHD